MKFYNRAEFAKIMGVNPITLFKRHDLPNHDKLNTNRGRSGYLWSASTVMDYRDNLVTKLTAEMKIHGTFSEVCDACKIRTKQGKFLLGVPAVKVSKKTTQEKALALRKKIAVNSEESRFEIFLNISSRIRSKLNHVK